MLPSSLPASFFTVLPLPQKFNRFRFPDWDGKFLEDLTTKKYVDRLPVWLTVYRLLGISKLASGTGEAQAQAVIDALKKWGEDSKGTFSVIHTNLNQRVA